MRPLTLAALAATLLLPGCLGSVSPAAIPAAALSSHDWRLADTQEVSHVGGLVKQVTLSYRPVGGITGFGGGVEVVSVTDVPLIDESKYVPQALEDVGRQKGVTFSKIGSKSLELTNLGTVTGDEYDVDGAGVPAKAVVFVAPCSDFVVVVAYGATSAGGIFGGGSSLYQRATEVGREVTC